MNVSFELDTARASAQPRFKPPHRPRPVLQHRIPRSALFGCFFKKTATVNGGLEFNVLRVGKDYLSKLGHYRNLWSTQSHPALMDVRRKQGAWLVLFSNFHWLGQAPVYQVRLCAVTWEIVCSYFN